MPGDPETPIERCLAERGPPLPWVYDLAARLAGEDVDRLTTDAGVLSRSLGNAVDLFSLPGVGVSFDTTVEAEAVTPDGEPSAGGFVETVDDAIDVDVDGVVAGGRVPTLLEATERLSTTLDGASVLGGVTGPGRLTDLLLADDAGIAAVEETEFTAAEIGVEMANAYLERGADGIVVLEPNGLENATDYAEAVAPLRNVTSHYEGVTILALETLDLDCVGLAGEADFDAVTGGVEAVDAALEMADEAGVTLGVGVPRERFLDGSAAAFVESLPTQTLISSGWTVPPETEPEVLHRITGSA